MFPLLTTIILIPLTGAFLLLFIPKKYSNLIKNVGLFSSFLCFIISLLLWTNFDHSTSSFQFVEKYDWLINSNISVCLGVDGISLFFILLTTLLIPLCLLGSWHSVKYNIKEYFICFLVIDAILIAVFSVLDLFLFYICFESVLIPMFLIVGFWGSRERKIRASYLFFLYTLVGSVLLLLAILYIYFYVGTTDYQVLLTTSFSKDIQKILWLACFASFSVKIPIVPFHIWLPEAHVEAPTAGSVILAGVLLKLGTYGFIRFAFPRFPFATVYFTPLIRTFGSVAVIYTSLTAIRQTDIKRIIAYASVAHINLVLIGIFSINIQGIEGSILQILSHGVVSGALFFCVGVVYDRHHTRLVKYYSGLAHVIPIFISIFLLFTLANIAFPGTSSFVGEFLILAGAFQINTIATFFGATGIILGGGYSLWLFNRIAFGNIKIQYLKQFEDINFREFSIFVPLIFLCFVMGIYPEIFLDPIHVSVNNLIEHININV
jgi:proton-translocating NADH-quinone oxidoreductase chain M